MQSGKNGCFFVYDGCKETDKKTKLDKNNCKLIYTKETQAKIKYSLIKLCNNIKIIRKALFFSKNKNTTGENFKKIRKSGIHVDKITLQAHNTAKSKVKT